MSEHWRAAHLTDMSHTIPFRVPAGVPTGGQFAARSAREADIELHTPGVSASDRTAPDLDTSDYVYEQVRQVDGMVQRLVSRPLPDGRFTTSERVEDVEHDVRAYLSRLPQHEFDTRFGTVARLAELVSRTEAADPEDLDAYGAGAWEVNLDLSDIAVIDREAEDLSQHERFQRAVVEELDSRMYSTVNRLVAAELSRAGTHPGRR